MRSAQTASLCKHPLSITATFISNIPHVNFLSAYAYNVHIIVPAEDEAALLHFRKD